MNEKSDSDKRRKGSVIIKRVTKVSSTQHNGAWKVAFADFAISMMALFLVLWIMGATTEKQRKQMAEAVASNKIVELDGSSSLLEGAGGNSVLEETVTAELPSTEEKEETPKNANEAEIKEALARQASWYESQAQLGQLAADLSSTIQAMKVSDSVVIEVVEQGVRVRFQDQAKKPLFASGSRELSGYFVKILRSLGPAFAKINNRVMISGHSDATPLNNAFYSNWELSTERAITARHVLSQNGMKPEQVIQLAGYADTMPIEGKDPLDSVNRRIEILILTEKGEKELKKMFKNSAAPVPSGTPSSASPTATTPAG
ncbi:OmpA family protein [Citrobacter sp. Awk 4]|uniref:flagellar motor protein MotB n=1 Tax=Citrobacter sp. Awk 4 TaxID=2963955 RepID=UPI0023028AD3|nr:flagellar motor protein MotB [Citrobacter sp. Awk 4]MDA8481284.1 OmpA family protein [Citrobacter sp. Awk 4]